MELCISGICHDGALGRPVSQANKLLERLRGQVRHFFENPTDEHDDGAITGEVFMCLAEGKCRRVDTFRIEPDGSVTHAPDFFKKVGA